MKPKTSYQAGVYIPGSTKLSSNELTLPTSEKVLRAINSQISSIHRYPDSKQTELRETITKFFDVDYGQIVLGNGSDEIIGFISQEYLRKDAHSRVLSAKETFSMYRIVSEIENAEYEDIPLKEGYFDLNTILERANKNNPNIIFICNPNNPTGTFYKDSVLKEYIKKIPRNICVVIDEAYIDFAQDDTRVSIQEKLSWHPKLIVLRTFSKAFGLGGLRIGMGICNQEIASILESRRMPFNITQISLVAANAALLDNAYYIYTIDYIRREKSRLYEFYTQLKLPCYESHANFLCIDVSNIDIVKIQKEFPSDFVSNYFAHKKITIRSLTSFKLPNMVRITIGTKEDNDRVIEIFNELIKTKIQ